MTTTHPTCQHQWVDRSSMGDPWRECLLCGKQEDVKVRRPDLGWDLIESDISPLDALSEDEFRRHRLAAGIESLRYMQQRYGARPRRVRTRRWWFFWWALLAFEVLQVAAAATILVMQ